MAPARSVLVKATAPEATLRIDRWLWSVRIFKTRALATAACRAGGVTVQDLPAKPAREVRAGERVQVRQGLVLRTLVVNGHPPARVAAKLVPAFCTETTPPEEWAKAAAQRVQHLLAREKGTGRPTKRERRQIDGLFG